MKNVTTLALASALVAGASDAMAQSRSSFLDVSAITGIDVVPISTMMYQVTLHPGALFTVAGTDYPISDVIGFWSLSNTNDLASTTTATGNWLPNSNNAGPGGIAGWKAQNANAGITPAQTVTFTFDTFDSPNHEQWGFHVRLASGTFPGTTGNTGHITAIPAPASGAALGLLGLFATRRRR